MDVANAEGHLERSGVWNTIRTQNAAFRRFRRLCLEPRARERPAVGTLCSLAADEGT